MKLLGTENLNHCYIGDCSEFLVRGGCVGGLGYGWGSGKSGIRIKAFLYIKFFKKKV